MTLPELKEKILGELKNSKYIGVCDLCRYLYVRNLINKLSQPTRKR